MWKSPSRVMVVVLCAVLLLLRTIDRPSRALTWDVFGYYLYLPALLIHGDPGLRDHAWLDEVMTTYEPSATLYQLVDRPDGNRVIKYTAGMAVAYAPFFLIAHMVAAPLGYAADGFSTPYQYLISFGCLLYTLIGLFLLRRVLLRWFDEIWVALLLLLTVLGTNLLQLAAWDGTLLTHPTLFALFAALLLVTTSWHDRPTFGKAALIGVLGGLIALVRPPEAIVLSVPLLWAMTTSDQRKAKGRLWRDHALHLGLAFLLFALVFLPQMLYWKSVAGEWFYMSYANNPGEGFDLDRPHLADFLFSFRKGWLVYTPLMALGLLGLPLLFRQRHAAAWGISIYVVAQLWIASSWSTWWYAGGSFSARSMVPAYALLVLPLGLILQQWWSTQRWRWVIGIVVGLLVVLNLFQTLQWRLGIIDRERMTGAYYRAVFGRLTVPEGARDLLLVERSTTAEEYLTRPDRYTARTIFDEHYAASPEGMLVLTDDAPFSPGIDLPYAALTTRDHAWIRATAMLWVDSATTTAPLIVMAFHHKDAAYKYRASPMELTSGVTGWVIQTMDYITPEVRSTADNLKVYLWNMHGGEHHIGRLTVEVFEPKD